MGGGLGIQLSNRSWPSFREALGFVTDTTDKRTKGKTYGNFRLVVCQVSVLALVTE